PLAPDAVGQAVDVLARAFRDNPLNTAVLESHSPSARQRCNAHGMRAFLPVARAHGYTLTARLGERLTGVLVAAPPSGYPLPPPRAITRLRTILGQGLRAARRWGHVFETLKEYHPSDPHWYLATLGVAPDHQGRGIGTALLGRWLARVDADRSASYLETDRSENLPFYERAGFAVVTDARVFGTPVWLMQRRARAHPSGAGDARRASREPD
ncbi:MAG: GNAT family N-acetyltransferase, partial [Deltaproteobacteria bacterium]